MACPTTAVVGEMAANGERETCSHQAQAALMTLMGSCKLGFRFMFLSTLDPGSRICRTALYRHQLSNSPLRPSALRQ